MVAAAVRRDFDDWREDVSSAFVPLFTEPLPWDRGFAGCVRPQRYGPVLLAKVTATPHRVERNSVHIDEASAAEVKISIPVVGRAHLQQGQTERTLRPGEAALYHCDREYELTMPDPFEQLVVQLDRDELSEHVDISVGSAVELDGSSFFTGCLRALVAELTTREQAPSPAEAALLGQQMLDLVALSAADALAVPVATPPAHTDRYLTAVAVIRQRLSDQDLGPVAVARASNCSVRSLHEAFRRNGQTVNDFIVHERLTRVRADLQRDDRSRHLTITEIATSWGFTSPSHFSRRFAERFGETATACRAAARGGA